LLFLPKWASKIISALSTKPYDSCQLRAIPSSRCFCSSLSLISGQVRIVFFLLSHLSTTLCTRLSDFSIQIYQNWLEKCSG
jgi:hypothetical protein